MGSASTKLTSREDARRQAREYAERGSTKFGVVFEQLGTVPQATKALCEEHIPEDERTPSVKQTSSAPDPRGRLESMKLTKDDDHFSKMEKILISKVERRVFHLFLEEEFSEEMLGFFKASEAYQSHACKFASMRKHTQSGAQHVRLDEIKLQHPHIIKVAKLVYDTYVAPGAPQAVNLSSRMVNDIKKAIKSGSVTTELFHRATKDVKKHMAIEKLPRFSAWVQTDAALEKILDACALDESGHIVRKDGDSSGLPIEGLSSYAGSDLASKTGSVAGRRASRRGSGFLLSEPLNNKNAALLIRDLAQRRDSFSHDQHHSPAQSITHGSPTRLARIVSQSQEDPTPLEPGAMGAEEASDGDDASIRSDLDFLDDYPGLEPHCFTPDAPTPRTIIAPSEGA